MACPEGSTPRLPHLLGAAARGPAFASLAAASLDDELGSSRRRRPFRSPGGSRGPSVSRQPPPGALRTWPRGGCAGHLLSWRGRRLAGRGVSLLLEQGLAAACASNQLFLCLPRERPALQAPLGGAAPLFQQGSCVAPQRPRPTTAQWPPPFGECFFGGRLL